MTNEEKLRMIERLGASGAQIQINIDGTDICFNKIVAHDQTTTTQQSAQTLPAELVTPKATRILAALFEAGIVDDGFSVCDGSLSKQAIVAEEVTRRLFIGEDIHWSLFERYWGVKNLRAVKKTLNGDFRKAVKQCIAVNTRNKKMQ